MFYGYPNQEIHRLKVKKKKNFYQPPTAIPYINKMKQEV